MHASHLQIRMRRASKWNMKQAADYFQFNKPRVASFCGLSDERVLQKFSLPPFAYKKKEKFLLYMNVIIVMAMYVKGFESSLIYFFLRFQGD